jgi:hypothetical protein
MCAITAPGKKSGCNGLFSCCAKPKAQEGEFVEISADVYTSKGLFLDSVWRKGIPARFRKKIWPFAIRNNLDITKSLFEILVQRLQRQENDNVCDWTVLIALGAGTVYSNVESGSGDEAGSEDRGGGERGDADLWGDDESGADDQRGQHAETH